MSNREHMMGYLPAANEFFGDDNDLWTWFHGKWALGTPRRVLDQFERACKANPTPRDRALATPVLRLDYRCSTNADLCGLERKKRAAIREAMPVASALGLEVQTLSENDTFPDNLVRKIAHVEDAPAISGGYPCDIPVDPYKRYIPTEPGKVTARLPLQEAVRDFGDAMQQAQAKQMAQELTERLNQQDQLSAVDQYNRACVEAQRCMQAQRDATPQQDQFNNFIRNHHVQREQARAQGDYGDCADCGRPQQLRAG